MASTLIVDDESYVQQHLAVCLRHRGHHVETADDAAEALVRLARGRYDVVLLATETSPGDRLALLREILGSCSPAVILATDHPTVTEAVEAIRHGAYDYLPKPLSIEQLDSLLRQIGRTRAERSRSTLLAPLEPLLSSANPAMARALATAREAAETDVTILLHGESGTGKHVLAAAIHGWSRRRDRPLVSVRPSTLANHPFLRLARQSMETSLVASWVGRAALAGMRGGTLFVEDLETLADELGPSLPRFLEEHRLCGAGSDVEVTARIIAATELSPDTPGWRLDPVPGAGSNVVLIALPPLRSRPEDLVPLTDHLLSGLVARHRRAPMRVSDQVRKAFARYPWPGNVRELLTVLERAVVLATGDTVGAEALPEFPPHNAPADPAMRDFRALSLAELERHHIETVVSTSPTMREAAARLGIDQATLWRKRKRYCREARRH